MWPKPFPDLSVDHRTQTQRSADVRLAHLQSARLAGTAVLAQNVNPDLVAALKSRREGADQTIVQVESAQTGTGQQTLVVPAEVLVRRRRDGRVEELAGPILGAAFTRRDLSPELVCPELIDRLVRYDAPDRPAWERRGDVDQLATASLTGGLATVPVLQHHGGPSPVVVKAPGGAAPTEVTAPATSIALSSQPRIVVAVIDTGVSAEARGDGWLADLDRSLDRIDPLDAFPAGGSPPHGNGFLDFAAGHGTFAAGIIRQVEPHAEIRIYRALDSDGVGSEVAVACAMVRAVKDGAQIVSLSLGTHTDDGLPPVAFEAALDAIDELSGGSEAPVFVAAAGNSGTTELVWPAASTRVIAVAALTPDSGPAAWSSRGPWVDCSTIGQGVVSTYVEGTEDTAFGGTDSYGTSAWAMWTGTSFAAPQIAAAIARLCRETGLPPRAAADRLIAAGTPVPDFGQALELLPGT